MPGATTGFDIDRVVLDGAVTEQTHRRWRRTWRSTRPEDARIELTVAPSTSSAWLVLQQSWNAGWTASSDGTDLGPPVLVNGYANGWLLPPSELPRSITLEWAPQRTMNLALWFSLLAGVMVIGLLIWTRRDHPASSIDDLQEADDVEEGSSREVGATGRGWSRTSPVVAAALVALIAFLAGPAVAVGALVVIVLQKTVAVARAGGRARRRVGRRRGDHRVGVALRLSAGARLAQPVRLDGAAGLARCRERRGDRHHA